MLQRSGNEVSRAASLKDYKTTHLLLYSGPKDALLVKTFKKKKRLLKSGNSKHTAFAVQVSSMILAHAVLHVQTELSEAIKAVQFLQHKLLWSTVYLLWF